MLVCNEFFVGIVWFLTDWFMFLKLLQRITEIPFSYFENNPVLMCSVNKESVEACVRWNKIANVIQNANFTKASIAVRMSCGFNGKHSGISFMHLRKVLLFSWNLHNSWKHCVQISCTSFHQIRLYGFYSADFMKFLIKCCAHHPYQILCKLDKKCRKQY